MTKCIFSINKISKNIQWNTTEDRILLENVIDKNRKSWITISKLLKKTRSQCYLRWKSINPQIKKGCWTKDEDNRLIRLFNGYGKKWRLIAKYFPNRYPQQIRDRYLNQLNPSLKKSNFTISEDYRILELFRKYGNKWTTIATHIEGRSPDRIKNRYNSTIKKNQRKLDDYKIKSQTSLLSLNSENCYIEAKIFDSCIYCEKNLDKCLCFDSYFDMLN
jgi:hypothetical protein